MEYSVPKPTYPIYLKLLAGLVTIGLVGLGIVSFETFYQVHGPVVAAIFACLIEVGAALDAIGLAGGVNGRTWWLIPAVILTVIGSGWYNYAAVAASGATWGIKDSVQLDIVAHAIAWLPLGSLSFMALGLGFKIADYEQSVAQWTADRQAWLDAQITRAEAVRLETQRIEQAARERQVEIDRQTREREQEAARKERERLAEIEAANKRQIELAKIAQQDRDAQRQARLEAKRIKVEAATKQAEASTAVPGTSTPEDGSSVETATKTYEDFRELLRSNHHNWKNEELAKKFDVSTRTITTWRAKYKSELEAAPAGGQYGLNN